MRLNSTHIVAILIFVVLLFAVPSIFAVAVEETERKATIEDEPFNVQQGEFTNLTQSNADLTYYDDETVENQSGNEMVEGNDYTWNTTNGTVKPLVGGNLGNNTTATITYSVYPYRVSTFDIQAILSNGIILMGVGGIIIAGIFLVLGLLILGDSFGGGAIR